MRKGKYLYIATPAKPAMTKLIMWLLFGTTALSFVSAQADERTEKEFYYDSSLQRSNFISIDPRYENILMEQIKDRRAQFLWKIRFNAEDISTDDNIQSQAVGATLRGKFQYKFMDNLELRSKMNVSLASGRTQDVFGELFSSSGVYPRELKLQYKPFGDLFIFNFGQIHQRWLNEPLFLSNLGFPGISETIGYANKKIALDFIAQQLIPTSNTLSTRVTEKEKTPTFMTESIQATYQISSQNFAKGQVTHYKYRNLPAIVAFESGIHGNSIGGFDQKNSYFKHEFDGFMYQMTFEQKFTNNISAQIQWNTIKNTTAPDELGEAQAVKAWVANDFGRWIVTGSYTNYFIEGDAVPAAYNSYRFGHNNRIGNSYELDIESKEWGIIFRGVYTDANILRPSAERAFDGIQQDNQQTIYFAVETMYDFI